MSNKLEQLRAQLQKQQNAGQNNNNSANSGENPLFQFWNMKSGQTATIRFLPNSDESNPFFWIESRKITLPFDGVVGDSRHDGKEIKVTVPCMKMYDQAAYCPVLAEINKYWKTELEDVARKYWPKRSYIMQGFVRDSGEMVQGKEDTTPTNPIRRFVINKSIHNLIQQAILDPDMENLPTDYENGTDFRIIKTQQGEYANYQTSSFARKESPLTTAEREALDMYGLYDLKDFIPNRPSEDGVAVIEEMFNASLNGLAYDPKWAEFFKPYGIDFNTGSTGSTQAPSSSSAPSKSQTESTQGSSVSESTQSVSSSSETTETGAEDDSNDVLARLRKKLGNE